MAWTMANYIDEGTTTTLQNPVKSLLAVVFAAFCAGGELVYHFTKSWASPNVISVVGDFFIVAIPIGIA